MIEVKTTEEELQRSITIEKLDDFCPNLFLLEENVDDLRVGTIWGEFSFFRQEITGGVRMGLLDCPNALTWTITTGYPPARDQIVVHLTINRTRKAERFVEEIHEFLDEWAEGLPRVFNNLPGD